MKLATIVRGRQDCAAVVMDLPEGWDGPPGSGAHTASADEADPNPPPPGQSRYYLDIGAARDLLTDAQQRLLWPAGLTYLDAALFGQPTEPLRLHRLLAGGRPALAALGDLVATVRQLVLRGDSALVVPALVPASAARLRTPVPETPIFYVLHGNSVIVWRRQVGIEPTQHIMTRVPAMRVRTLNALLGHNEPLYLPPGSDLTFGNELGFVIGQAARNVSAERAYAHVAGYVCTNDGYSNVYSPMASDAPTRISSAMQVGDKATDGCGPVGPWIATPEEVGDPHDLLLFTRQDGRLRNRAYSGSYIVGVEEAIERLSHRFTLPPGTIVSLGAAGWDGLGNEPADPASGRSILDVEVERVGVLRTPIIYPDAAEQSERAGASPYLFVGTINGATPLDRLTPSPSEGSTVAGQPQPRGFWMLFGNQREAERLELERSASPLPAPVAYPITSLAQQSPSESSAADPHAIDLAPDAGTIRVTCQLALVIGPEPAYAETTESAGTRIAGYATLLSVHDGGTLEHLVAPTTDYEQRHTTYLGYCGEGQQVLAPVSHNLEATEILAGRRSALQIGTRTYEASTADYTHGPAAVVQHLSTALTLLPGDVIGLGPLGPAVELPSEELAAGLGVSAAIDGLAPVQARLRRAPS